VKKKEQADEAVYAVVVERYGDRRVLLFRDRQDADACLRAESGCGSVHECRLPPPAEAPPDP